ncbi:uncharacterized protein TNCV_4344581 [Trichonephila clavipes]|nr:uncharacterized protein TNCV_4344581 [Trichonephila clavipes]
MYIQDRFGSYRSIEWTKTDWNCTRYSIITCFAQTSDSLARLTQTLARMPDPALTHWTRLGKLLTNCKFDVSRGFELRKWSCTHPEVLSDLPNILKTNISSNSFDDESTQKIIGLFWALNEDSFKVREVLSDQVSTKRQMLSIIARIFDPLWFVSPSTIILKIILQDRWKAGLDWDDGISSDILNRWNRFQAEISCLKQIKVPRNVQILNAKHCEIHGFCDASSKVYSAVIYLRVVSDSPPLFLMASKTRVAPVQTISTILCQIEACINSRPLYPLSSDPKDLRVLTPVHFPIGCPLLELPDHSLTNQPLSIHSRGSLLMKLKRMFWSRWQLSHLHTLQSQTKWMQGQKDLTVGPLVLIKNPASFSTRWTPGRIVATHSGADGMCRVVTIQTSCGVMTKPVSQIAVLPLPPSTTSSRSPEDERNS